MILERGTPRDEQRERERERATTKEDFSCVALKFRALLRGL
jgi:hypothetical protein